ncbi:hypothetical protein RCL10_05955 [Staphylococcus lloydii]|uniref:hypothetical protein n=1 Tax=Staphylococcus lloydii TaxID=2781774 RepID=UPI002929998C|nr:hypothetical protein [Staphylococcus lloydii]MDU9418074.1 hypothetical protein [Staphylococcus lloydii]
MAYENKIAIESCIKKVHKEQGTIEKSESIINEIEEVYRKAKAYDLLKEDLLINEKVFREQAKNDEVSNIIHGHYTQLLAQSELERGDDER